MQWWQINPGKLICFLRGHHRFEHVGAKPSDIICESCGYWLRRMDGKPFGLEEEQILAKAR